MSIRGGNIAQILALYGRNKHQVPRKIDRSLSSMARVHSKKFRINPVEWLIFSIMTFAFGYSSYCLIYQDSVFTKPLGVSSYRALDSTFGATRMPASVAHPLLNVELKCSESEAAAEQTTQASKLRISGETCDQSQALTGVLKKTSIINSANRFAATVFMDTTTHKFSTDYIPLNLGKNTIHIEFSYAGGKIQTRDLIVTKN